MRYSKELSRNCRKIKNSLKRSQACAQNSVDLQSEMSLFVESAKSDLYKLYRTKKSTREAPRSWWKYSILSTIYQMRQTQRADIWTVVAHRNMDVLHNLRKALKLKSLMLDPNSLNHLFDADPLK